MSDSVQPKITTRGGALTEGRMPCPDCGATIPLPFESLFAGRALHCNGCGLELSVDLAASQKALEALRRAQKLVNGLNE